MEETRYGDWIEVYGGEKFYPLDPRPEEIKLETIAHGLSMMCRFNGQCKRFFSVAQHSINVTYEVENLTREWDKKDSLKAQLLAIFHDASECLGISDICAPAKKYMPEYQMIEKGIQDSVWKAFGIEHTRNEYDIVNMVDKAMSAYEAAELMDCRYWDLSQSYLILTDRSKLTHIDLSDRGMKSIESKFILLAKRLLKEYEEC